METCSPVFCEVWQRTRALAFLWPEGFRLPRNVTFGVYPDSGMVTQKDTVYSWEATLGILSLPLQDGHFPSEAFDNHGNRDL